MKDTTDNELQTVTLFQCLQNCILTCLSRARCFNFSTLFLILLIILVCNNVANARTDASLESKIKIAYLYNFLRFIEWPETSASTTLRLCVAGNKEEYQQPLQALARQKVREHSIIITHIEPKLEQNLAQSLRQCHLIFITNRVRKQQNQIIESIAGSEVLTIGESDDFIYHGGMINFIQQQDKIRFEVNLQAINQTHLHISSKVLRIASRVIE